MVDFFLKIDGIPGESADSKHKDEIDVISWSWGANQTGTMSYGGGGGAGKVNFQDFSFTMRPVGISRRIRRSKSYKIKQLVGNARQVQPGSAAFDVLGTRDSGTGHWALERIVGGNPDFCEPLPPETTLV